VKDGLDRLLAAAGLVLLTPVLLMVAIAVRLTTPGPALFVQTRVGRDGRPFRMVKFRTMHRGADALVGYLLPYNEAPGPLFKLRNDPRVTRLGRFLRRHSIDELPQLVNVLLGSMSLVGPRPPLPAEVAKYDAHANRRLQVKPGLTGLWQISGRSDLSWHDSLNLDLQYIERWSLRLDLKVLLRTARVVVRSRGAY
jgi:lipopolysaccharide/colanic/teichoic acid biosynthesis glycosyltransferase